MPEKMFIEMPVPIEEMLDLIVVTAEVLLDDEIVIVCVFDGILYRNRSETETDG